MSLNETGTVPDEKLEKKICEFKEIWNAIQADLEMDAHIIGPINFLKRDILKTGLSFSDIDIDQKQFEAIRHDALIRYLKCSLDEQRQIGRTSNAILSVCGEIRKTGISPEEIGTSRSELIKLAIECNSFGINLNTSLDQFAQVLPDGNMEHLVGKKVLDLGCGSYNAENGGKMFAPHLCRFLWYLGADPVGIDIGDLEIEPFEHYNVDLSQPGALDFLPDDSFDYVHSLNLIDDNPSPTFYASLHGKQTFKDARQQLLSQACRVLKKEGFLLLKKDIYQKHNGQLEQIFQETDDLEHLILNELKKPNSSRHL